MSLPPEEARAVRAAWDFLRKFSRGGRGVVAGKEARDILRHFPLGGDLEHAAKAAAPELLGKVEREADQLAQECARLQARVNELEERFKPVPDYLNVV